MTPAPRAIRRRATGARLLTSLVLAAVLLAPAAAAAGHGDAKGHAVSLTAEEVPGPIAPERAATSDLRVAVPCAALENRTAPLAVALAVEASPPWAQARVEPPEVAIPTGGCDDGAASTTGNATLRVTTTRQAPALAPGAVRVAATAPGLQPANATVNVTADYVGKLDVAAQRTEIRAEPQEAVDVVLTVTNHGNGPTVVAVTAMGGTPGLRVVAPGAVTLDARPTGGDATTRDLVVSLQAPFHAGYVTEVDTLTLLVEGHFADDPAREADAHEVTVTLRTEGLHAPGPAAAAAAAALALAALTAHRRARWRG